MNRLILMLISAASLSGCAVFDESFTEPKSHKGKWVEWRTVPDPHHECSKDLPRKVLNIWVGCATWTDTTCTVITGQDTTNAILGHEIRHCFQGSFHD